MSANPRLSDLFQLNSRVTWIVGGGGYLARPVCQLLAELGAHLVIADRRIEAAEEAATALQSLGHTHLEAASVDVGDESSVAQAVEAIQKRYGKLDIAVNMTAYSTGKAMDAMTGDDFLAGVKVTLGGSFLIAKHAAAVMLPRKAGSIVHFASMYGVVSPDPSIYAPKWSVNPVDYGAGKAAVLQMTRYQAVMWGPSNVRVNAVTPGPFPNPIGQGADPEFLAKLSKKAPLGRVGKSHEIAGAVAYLASDASSYMTGQQLIVDGGWTAW